MPEPPTVLRTVRLQLGDVLVELRALIGGEDVTHLGDPRVEALLHLGAAGAEAGGVTTLAARTRGSFHDGQPPTVPRTV